MGRRPLCPWVRRAFLCAVMIGFLIRGAGGSAGSLWSESSSSLFSDHKASKVGDLLTVIIVERSYATNKAQTDSGKGASVGVEEGTGLLSFIPELGFGSKTKFQGGNTTTRMGTFTANMTAKVIEVLPNGNLKIEGTQGLVVNKERQNIVITGIVRPQDISRSNTILSTYVADAEIRYEGTLNVEERKGILGFLSRFFGSILDLLF